MGEVAPKKYWTEEEYLALEERSQVRHEYYQGEIFAMSGGSYNHGWLISRLTQYLSNALLGTNCATITTTVRVRVEETGLYTYPDLLVVCGEPELDRHTLLNPTFVVEILSPGTEQYDRTIKFDHYARVPSIKGYLLVSQDFPRLELVSRNSNGWNLAVAHGLESVLEIAFLGVKLSLKDIYQGIKFPPQSTPREP